MPKPSMTTQKRRRITLATGFFVLVVAGGALRLVNSGVRHVGPWIAVVGGLIFVVIGVWALCQPVEDQRRSTQT